MQKKLLLIFLVSVAQINALSKLAVALLSSIAGFAASYSGPNAMSLIFDKAREIKDPELRKQWLESLRDFAERNRKASLRRAERYEDLGKKMKNALDNIPDKAVEMQDMHTQIEEPEITEVPDSTN
ncbi:hypothetical protein A3F66_06110 [candidate division TM6 bacterium RIFCSPHIGHO2_12_FULL_32_22]|nr:MAG: hypothetical protein A3F66_06110 [candidate division TM6 bacterium RIFCSPHIGHO2_12_FULL_32_22]